MIASSTPLLFLYNENVIIAFIYYPTKLQVSSINTYRETYNRSQRMEIQKMLISEPLNRFSNMKLKRNYHQNLVIASLYHPTKFQLYVTNILGETHNRSQRREIKKRLISKSRNRFANMKPIGKPSRYFNVPIYKISC